MKKLSLKKLKFHEDMSEETPCFSADLYENGKLIAHVSNRGHGGCNDVSPAAGIKYKDIAYIESLDTDCDIMQLAEDLNLVKKNQSKRFVLKKDDKTYTAELKGKNSFSLLKKVLTQKDYEDMIQKRLAGFKAQGYEVLNTNLGI